MLLISCLRIATDRFLPEHLLIQSLFQVLYLLLAADKDAVPISLTRQFLLLYTKS